MAFQALSKDACGNYEDQYVYLHNNGLSVVGLAGSHRLFTEGKMIESVSFNNGCRDLSKNVVRGAKKRGGAFVKADDTLATIVCADKTVFIVRSCVDGCLLEVNKRLITHPQLLNAYPLTRGYIAILKPPGKNKFRTDRLSSLHEYRTARQVSK